MRPNHTKNLNKKNIQIINKLAFTLGEKITAKYSNALGYDIRNPNSWI